MGEFIILMPDVGEGIAEAEIAELLVPVGDELREDDVFAAVMTDKATVEIPSSVTGTVLWYAGEVGDTIAIGAPLVKIEVDGPGNADAINAKVAADAPTAQAEPEKTPEPEPKAPPVQAPAAPSDPQAAAQRQFFSRPAHEKPIASPAVRRRAMESGVDLRQVMGSGPGGRISQDDLDAFVAAGGTPAPKSTARDLSVKETKIIGLRRKIAERMVEAKTRIPHITIVEEIDMTSLEKLRANLNHDRGARPKLTLLPFLMSAMVKAVQDQPQLNAHFDDGAGILREYGAAHIGIATQTPNGLMVPVVRHAEARTIWDLAAELARVAEAARDGSATREELSGSTISITSLGKLGAVATTPIINHPEVAIVGVNKMAMRPMWNGSEFVPRQVMNLSNSFDHRVIDGWDAAVFVQRIKALLESPAMIFVER